MEVNCEIVVGISKCSTTTGSTTSAVGLSPLRSPQVERLRSMSDKDAGRSQPKQGNKTPAKHHNVSEKSAGLKHRTKTPNKTPVADRYVVKYQLSALEFCHFLIKHSATINIFSKLFTGS